MSQDLLLSSSQSESLARLAQYVRMTIRSLAGEDPESATNPSADLESFQISSDSASASAPYPEGYREGGYSGSPPPLEDWALEREIEITRLEKENEELRGLLGIGQDENLMKESFMSNGSMSGSVFFGGEEGTSSPSGSRPGSPALARLTQGMPIRRGLLSQNRARMMGGGNVGSPGPGGNSALSGGPVPNRPGSGMGEAQVGPFIAAAPPGSASIQVGPGQVQGQGQQQWPANDAVQRKMTMGSYFKEFPT